MKSSLALAASVAAVALGMSVPVPAPVTSDLLAVVAANDNRVAAGTLRDGVLRLDMDVVWAGWRPDADVDTLATVQAFAERGKAPTIPGPLVRVSQGTEVRVTIRNLIPDSTLIVHGLRAGTMANDTFSVAPGATREIVFAAVTPGTFLYWGTTSHSALGARHGRDALLSGAIVVDPPGAAPDPRERIFVVSLIDIVPDTTKPGAREDIWEVAINGKSWPHTERLSYALGDTAKWRFLNATDRPHPMHLHGFHFLVTSKGTGATDTTYAPAAQRLAVTEFMAPGSTFSLEWNLTRPGNWLVHCHMLPHIVPYPERSDSTRHHDVQAVEKHPTVSMAGLVLGVSVSDPRGSYVTPEAEPVTRRTLFLQEASPVAGVRPRKGFVLQREAEPAPDSVEVPGSTLVVVRGERTSITIVNRLKSPSSVHWHGMELESVFDGVAGFSGVGTARAPLLAPGDSFTVWFTPPRAGTYMYHTHMDEEDQLASGMYGALLVLEPGERYDPSTDLVMMVGLAPGGREGFARALNGAHAPEPITVRSGGTYRLRLLNMLIAAPLDVTLSSADSTVQHWRLVSKDGASTPAALSGLRPAALRMGVGETYDFEWIAPAGEYTLKIHPLGPPGTPRPPALLQRVISKP